MTHQTPTNASPYHFLARIFTEQDRYDEALQVYLELSDITPSANADVDKMIGLLYIEQGDATQAVRYLESVLKEEPADTEARFNLARGYMMKGDLRKAGQEVLRVLSYDPNYPRARQVADFLAQQVEAQQTETNGSESP